ncbi:MAG: hypothetical protein ACREFW_07090 [Rhizomicrobium sp.]
MKLTLPAPSGGYDAGNEARARALIEQADNSNVKLTSVLASFQMRDTATGQIRTVKMTSGAFVIT